ncbi:viroplasmin family protein [Schaedlerella sp.]|uniref:ribonuclease H1 domain-containing protein n=1 Tax=Schaedlerella sp. TaxID=2676057 RepID=UPI0037466D18
MNKKEYYIVKIGKNPGMYRTWDECEEQVKYISGAKYKGCRTLNEARDYLKIFYSPLDRFGRCGTAMTILSKDSFQTKNKRKKTRIKPSGWEKGKYHRCHLIGCQFGGTNSRRNLITGTCHFNVDCMYPIEEEIAKYVNKDGMHNYVFYQVTPVYENDNLLASKVIIKAYSIGDNELCIDEVIDNK